MLFSMFWALEGPVFLGYQPNKEKFPFIIIKEPKMCWHSLSPLRDLSFDSNSFAQLIN
jgi:hypothetical protein